MNIKSIIGKYQGQMESAGLLRRPETMQLSPKVAAMPTSFTKARLALQEYSRASVKVQDSPMTMLFEYTLPKLEPLLMELGEERAEQIVSKLCEHGKKMIGEHGVEGARDHLEELFKDLPDYESKIKEKNGIGQITEAYRKLHFEDGGENYLRIRLGNKIVNIETDGYGNIYMELHYSADDSDLFAVSKVKMLKRLHLCETFITNNGIFYISKLVNLEELYIENGLAPYTLEKLKTRQETKKYSQLKTSKEITEEGIFHLAKLNNLKKLYLNGIDKVTDKGMLYLSNLTNLQELRVNCFEITDSGLANLANFANLLDLHLFVWGREEPIDEALFYISKLQHLQVLDLNASSFTDAGLRHIGGMTSLISLDLSGTDITDAGLEYLSGLNNLKEINLESTEVTDGGIAKFSLIHPDVKIFYERYPDSEEI